MNKNMRKVALAGLATLFLCTSALAEGVCEFVNKLDETTTSADDVRNGSVFFLTTKGWRLFKSFGDMQLEKQQKVTFVYVVEEKFRGDRSGALVIKSGIYGADSANNPQGDQVKLVRKDNATDKQCIQPQPFKDTLVSGKGYEDYHDYQLTETPELKGELKAFERFHMKYRTDNGCVGTDDMRTGYFSYDNNAAQFSYNTAVVDGGANIGIRFNFTGRPAYAAQSVFMRRTELKYYRTSAGMHCSKFDLVVNGDERNFIRVNDLEGRQEPPSSKRSKEFRVEN